MTGRRAPVAVVVAGVLALALMYLGTRPAGLVHEGGWAFETCTGAHNAGVTPMRGDPDSGYHRALDDNGNGVACEPGEGPQE